MERFTAGWIRPETGYIHLFFIAMKVPHSREGEIWHSRPLLSPVTRDEDFEFAAELGKLR